MGGRPRYRGYLNDLWTFDGNEWTWIKGSDLTDQGGIYGPMGAVAGSYNPGGRDHGAAWADTAGNLWLFGGEGYGEVTVPGIGYLNDLWRFTP